MHNNIIFVSGHPNIAPIPDDQISVTDNSKALECVKSDKLDKNQEIIDSTRNAAASKMVKGSAHRNIVL